MSQIPEPKRAKVDEEEKSHFAEAVQDGACVGVETKESYPAPAWISAAPRWVANPSDYKRRYDRSLSHPDEFWRNEAKFISWFRDFDTVQQGSFEQGNVAWFMGGKLNVSYNCLDRHVYDYKRADKVAIIYEGDEPSDIRHVTYRELLDLVCKFANVLKAHGIRKGDSVCIYMPMVPEAAVAMLACTRIGATHSVVFAGFSAQSLSERIIHGQAKAVICADEGVRAGKIIPLKNTVRQ